MGEKQDGNANTILDMDYVKWVTNPPFEASGGKKAPAATLLPHMDTSYTGYFRNEACVSTVYASAAIVFTVPSLNSSGREAALAKAAQALGLSLVASPGGSAGVGEAACSAPTTASAGHTRQAGARESVTVRAPAQQGMAVAAPAVKTLDQALSEPGRLRWMRRPTSKAFGVGWTWPGKRRPGMATGKPGRRASLIHQGHGRRHGREV
eukprot:g9348.t1